MGHWNYRIFKNEAGELGFIECFYTDQGKPRWRTEFIGAFGETVEELKQDVEWMLKAFDKPIMTASDFPQSSGEEDDE